MGLKQRLAVFFLPWWLKMAGLINGIKPKDKMPVKRIWPCKFDGCSALFKKKSHLIRHEFIHNDERPYACDLVSCGKAFRSKYHLKRHKATHTGKKEFKCEFEGCTVSCITLWNLKRHVKRSHERCFKCEKCDKEFKKNKLYKEHVQHGHKTSSVSCTFPSCSQIFTDIHKFKLHMKVHANKEYVCSVKGCSMKFQLNSECLKHAAQCKKKEKQCDVCGKLFTHNSNLKAHMKIHSVEREVFQCTYDGCGRFYTKQYNLQVHVESFHKNIRPYVCPKQKCKRSFHFQHILRRHLNTHACNKVKQTCIRKRPVRSRRGSLVSGLTGYMSELKRNMSNTEIKCYIQQFESEPDTEILSPEPDSTTQQEMSPLTSSEMRANSDDLSTATARSSVDENITIVSSLKEVLTDTHPIMTSDVSDDGIVLERFKSIEEAHSYLQKVNTAKNCSSTPSSSATPGERTPGDDAAKVVALGEKLKQVVEARRDVMLVETCRFVSESDSSEGSETGKRMLMQHVNVKKKLLCASKHC